MYFLLCTQQHWNAQSSKIEGAQLSKNEPWFGHRREEDSRYDLTPVWSALASCLICETLIIIILFPNNLFSCVKFCSHTHSADALWTKRAGVDLCRVIHGKEWRCSSSQIHHRHVCFTNGATSGTSPILPAVSRALL